MGHRTQQVHHTYALDEDLRYITADAMWNLNQWTAFGTIFLVLVTSPPCCKLQIATSMTCKYAVMQDVILDKIQASLDLMHERIVQEVVEQINCTQQLESSTTPFVGVLASATLMAKYLLLIPKIAACTVIPVQ